MAEVEDKLGMTDTQWARWQSYTQGDPKTNCTSWNFVRFANLRRRLTRLSNITE